MKNACKNACIPYITPKTYIEGAVRCRTCYRFLEWDGIWCPCCNCRVSRRARGIASKSLANKMEHVARM